MLPLLKNKNAFSSYFNMLKNPKQNVVGISPHFMFSQGYFSKT
jgi:hypothetical protein